MARNPDPKHGRWILPLIITAMVVLTFTFVNNLDPAVDVAGTTTVPEPPFPTTPTSSTTTLPPEVQAFGETLNALEGAVEAFRDQVISINNDWEAGRESFGDTRSAFVSVRDNLQEFEEIAADNSQVPNAVAEEHVEFVVAVEDLPGAVEDVIAGLDAPDDGTLRRAAVEDFQSEIQEVLDALDAMRAAAEEALGGGSTTSTTTDDGSTDA
ncbi:MAG: hypothetical protein R3290_08620 [Acidimicrobiia bacterium]|nr:hypothetical protein [Acidimicrobiia bacterium]